MDQLPANMTEAEKKVMGEQLSAAAYAEPTIVPEGLARTLIIILSVTMAIATIVVAFRAYVRFPLTRWSKGWGWDDTFALLAYVSLPAFMQTLEPLPSTQGQLIQR